MRNLFRLDNPVMQFLSRVCDLMIVNVLFWLCCLPVVTVGASLTALHKVTQSIVLNEDGGVVKPFFRAFLRYRRPVMGVLVAAALVCLVLGVVVLSISVYYFHLVARYENTVRQHAMNAAILALVKLPRTVLMVLLTLLPVLVLLISMQTFVSTLIFWVILGFSFVSYLQSCLLRPVFHQLEPPTGPNVQLMD